MTINIDRSECIGCGMCECLCPENAIRVSPSYKAEVDPDACTECLSCIDICPTYSVTEYRQADLKCDVAVIGSGVGGLCAAALLANWGFKVVLLEKSPVLGGRFTSLWHNGCLLHTGALQIGHGYDSPVWHILKEVKATLPEVSEINQFRYRIAGKYFDTFMNEKGGLKLLIGSVAGRAEADRVMSALKKAMTWQGPSSKITLKDWILQYTDNEHILGIFQLLCSMLSGVYMHELPADAFIRVLGHEATHGGTLVPKNGLKDVVDSFEQAIKRDGGEVFTNSPVSKITVKDDRVTGAIIQRGNRTIVVESKAVVSNIGPLGTVQLVGQNHFTGDYLKDVRESVRATAGMAFHWLSDQPILDFSGILYVTDTRIGQCWIDFNGIWPHWKPAEKYLTFSYAVPLNAPPYNPEKMKQIILEDADNLFPDLREKEATLISAHDYRDAWPWTRAPQGIEMGQKTSIRNLYNVGDGVCPAGYSGGDAAAQSAMTVVRSIKDTFKST